MKNNRESNIELLRIICMILIIAHHYCLYGGFNFGTTATMFNENLVEIISVAGRIAVNCFILITGYFMITSKFNKKSLIKLILKTMAYSTIIMIIFYATSLEEFNWLTAIKCVFPMFYNMYWFVTTYILLCIFAPFINEFLNRTTQITHKKIIAISILIWSIIPTMVLKKEYYLDFSSLIWFIVLYIIGAYIRLYPQKLFENKFLACFISAITYILLSIGIVILNIVGENEYINIGYFYNLNNFLVFICSVFIFIIFKNIKIKPNRIINTVATSVISVYLIHENIFVRDYLWRNIIKPYRYTGSDMLIINMVFSVLVIFVVCTAIDQILKLLTRRKVLNDS